MFGWFPNQQVQECLGKLSYKSQPAGAKTGHLVIFKTSVWFMYLDTASISHPSLGINQLHFISRSAVFYWFYHSFSYCNKSFLVLLGSLYNAVLLLRVHAQSRARRIQSCHTRAHGCVACTRTQSCWLTIALVLAFLSVGTGDII